MRKIILPILFTFVLLLSSCTPAVQDKAGGSEPSRELVSQQLTSDIVSSEEQSSSNISTDEKSYSLKKYVRDQSLLEKIMHTENNSYSIKETVIQNSNDFIIEYPQIASTTIDTVEINHLLKEDADLWESLDIDRTVECEIYLGYNISKATDKFISIKYNFSYMNEIMPKPIRIFWTSNIDITQSKRMGFNDICNVDNIDFAKIICVENINHPREVDEEDVLWAMQSLPSLDLLADCIDKKYSYDYESAFTYYTDDSVIFLFEGPYVFNSFVEFKIPYTDLL